MNDTEIDYYIDSLMDWCDNLFLNWRKMKASFSKSFDLKSVEEWEESYHQLMKKLQNNDFERSKATVNELYQMADELYNQWRIFYEESQSYKKTLTETGLERGVSFSPPEKAVRFVQPGKHTLPPLPYAYNALEPYISEEIMRLHHNKHHQSYVDGLNKAEIEMEKARKSGDFSLLKHWEREAAFHGAGHYLHTIFWHVMSPDGGGKPKGEFAQMINASFGSYQAFKKHFSEAANQVEAVGWALLVWSPRSHRLEILQAEKHQNLSQWDIVPLLVLDVWEHAYYLQYKNNRKRYVENWWKTVHWRAVERRFNEAKTLKWQPF